MSNEDEVDNFDGADSEDCREEALRLLRGRGLLIGVKAALEIAANKKAPAPARAASAGLLLRAAGLLDRRDEGDDTDASQMTPEQLNRAVRKAESQLARLGRADDRDIFG